MNPVDRFKATRPIAGLLTCALLALLTACGAGGHVKRARVVGDSFLSALSQGNYTAAVRLVEPSQRSSVSAPYLSQQWEQLEAYVGKPYQYQWREMELSYQYLLPTQASEPSGALNTLVYEVRGTQGEARVTLLLRRSGRDWRVYRMDIVFLPR